MILMMQRALLLLGALLLFSAPLSADTLRLKVGYWPGDLEPELEGRYFKDDLVQGGLSRINLPWSNTQTNTIFPIGFEYALTGLGDGQLVLNANYWWSAPEYKFQGLGAIFFSNVTLKNYLTTDLEADLGYRFKLLDNRLTLMPKIGFRRHTQDFDYEELTIGTTFGISGASPFDATAAGTIIGLAAEFRIEGPWSLKFDYVRSLGIAGGSMTQEKLVVGSTSFSWERAESSYELDVERFGIGVGYDFSDDFGMELGVRQEKLRQQYIDYFGLPIVVGFDGTTSAIATVEEAITDRFFWEGTETSEKGLVFIAFHYDIDI